MGSGLGAGSPASTGSGSRRSSGCWRVWQLLVTTKIVNYAPLPGPIEIWSGFKYLAGSEGGLWAALWHTVRCVLIAWLIAVAVGGLVGLRSR